MFPGGFHPAYGAGRIEGLLKVVTRIRRCGKSYLIFTIFENYLLE